MQKLASIDRCLRAIRDYIAGDGFRNVAVHEYRRLDPAVVRTVVEHRLGDFEGLCRELSATS